MDIKRIIFVILLFVTGSGSGDALAQTEIITLEDGLLMWLELNEASGTRYDSHNNYDFVDINTVGTTAGINFAGAYFNGANEYLFNTAPNLQTDRDFSMSFWLKPENTSLRAIVRKTNSTTGFQVLTEVSGVTRAGFYNSSVFNYIENNNSLSSSKYSHIVITHTEGTVSLSIDGNEVTGTLTPTELDTTLYIASNLFIGGLDEFAIWTRVISDQEIEQLYNYGAGLGYDEMLLLSNEMKYTTILPSGGRGVFTLSASAGEVGTISILAALFAVALFDTMRDMFRRARATK